MSTVKDSVDLGLEFLQYWRKFRGRRVRVWPTDMTLQVCSRSQRKWVVSLEPTRPSWWDSPEQREKEIQKSGKDGAKDALVEYAADTLTGGETLHLESVDEARLFDATVEEIVRQPPGILFRQIQYWMIEPQGRPGKVLRIDSTDEELFLPMDRIARIDFVMPRSRNETSSDSLSDVRDQGMLGGS